MTDLKQLMEEAAVATNHVLAPAVAKLILDGFCCVHAVSAGHEVTLYASMQSGTPSKNGDEKMYPVIALERACRQVVTNPTPTNMVPDEYEGMYLPLSAGSFTHYNICVGVASDNPRNDRKIAVLYGTLFYEFFKEKMQEAGLMQAA